MQKGTKLATVWRHPSVKTQDTWLEQGSATPKKPPPCKAWLECISCVWLWTSNPADRHTHMQTHTGKYIRCGAHKFTVRVIQSSGNKVLCWDQQVWTEFLLQYFLFLLPMHSRILLKIPRRTSARRGMYQPLMQCWGILCINMCIDSKIVIQMALTPEQICVCVLITVDSQWLSFHASSSFFFFLIIWTEEGWEIRGDRYYL